jgi:hypothetical protein
VRTPIRVVRPGPDGYDADHAEPAFDVHDDEAASMSGFVFGEVSQTYCIPDAPPITGGSEPACLAYRVTYYGAILPGYMRDDGYAVKALGRNASQPLGPATIARGQAAGLLPNPMPPYSVPTSTYFYGFSLWPVLILFAVVAILRRRTARGLHAAARPPGVGEVTTGVEITASHNVLLFFQFLTAPAIVIDGQTHQRAWGTWTFEVAPGHHVISASYRWIWRRARESVELDVAAGSVARVSYHVGFFGGLMKNEASMPRARVTAS